MPKIDAIQFSCYTELYLFVYLLFLATYVINNVLSIIFFQYTTHDWLLLAVTILTCLLILGALCLLKFSVEWINKTWKVGELEARRNQVLVGLGGTALCGILPRVLVHFVEIEEWTVYFTVIVFTTTAIFFGILYLHTLPRNCKFVYSIHDKVSWALIIPHSIILLITMILGIDLQDWRRSIVIILCHVSFSVMCASSTIEIVKVLRGEFRILEDADDPELSVKMEKVRVIVHKSETDPQLIEPRITMFNYSI
ncbi:hypothetical protein L5515_002982 [Caenorhabditis briggsae]|uniref:Uncharacterized protein n=1 Tax=Caenorhabditis briggsae TaxID=6238 RepID=A0AAE9J9P8_CAEBR|nr:hypothetical protein L5515_002982 [Caenorhabditis briggsae]